MPIIVSIEDELKAASDFLTKDTISAVKRSISTSIKRTLTGIRKETTKAISSRRLINTRSLPVATIKRQYLRERVYASPSLPIDDMKARFEFSDKRPSLHHFYAKRVAAKSNDKARKNALGAKLYGAQVEVMGKKYSTGRAFIRPGSKGPILARTGNARLPVRKLYGPSFAIMVQKLGIAAQLQAYARARFGKEFEANLRYYLGFERTKG